ncbi:hypothetical protein C0J52_04899 [Blattella germanica]|nr:hypothetical protein C0J52_04899 [Blattella germanica]
MNIRSSQLGMRVARSNRISTKTGSTSSSEGNGDIFSSVRDFSKNYIVGSAPGISRALDNRPLSSSSFTWIIFHFLNAVLRTSGAPVFLNNPLSGFLILVAICVHDDGVGSAIAGTALLGMLVAATTAIWLFDEHDEQISEGTETFNGFIVGLILTDFNGLKQNPWLILVILLGSSMSCIVPISVVAPMPEIPTTSSAPVQLDWTEVLGGVIQTTGQIYACPNMLSSSLIYIALIVYSPILALLGLGGATIGTLIVKYSINLCYSKI